MIYFVSSQKRLFESLNIIQCDIEFSLITLQSFDSIAVDTETTGFDPHSNKILSLQLGNGDTQFVIDASEIDIIIYKQLLESKLLLFHNAQFDLRFLRANKIYPKKYI